MTCCQTNVKQPQMKMKIGILININTTRSNMTFIVNIDKFAHIKELYHIEEGKSIKPAHKLNDKVLNPCVLEKTNVKLADSLFHSSTINALIYY